MKGLVRKGGEPISRLGRMIQCLQLHDLSAEAGSNSMRADFKRQWLPRMLKDEP